MDRVYWFMWLDSRKKYLHHLFRWSSLLRAWVLLTRFDWIQQWNPADCGFKLVSASLAFQRGKNLEGLTFRFEVPSSRKIQRAHNFSSLCKPTYFFTCWEVLYRGTHRIRVILRIQFRIKDSLHMLIISLLIHSMLVSGLVEDTFSFWNNKRTWFKV